MSFSGLHEGSSHRKLDRFLANFVQHIYDSGGTKVLAKLALLSAQRKCVAFGRLPIAWRCLSTWHLEDPPRHRAPLPRSILEAMVLVARAWALGCTGQAAYTWWSVAVALLLGFVTLLRPGELLGLTKDRVILPAQLVGTATEPAVVVLVNPKNKRFMGATQFALVEELSAIRWLAWWTDRLGPHAKLFWLSRNELAECMRQLLRFLGCEALRFTPGSLRAGGATAHYMLYRDLGRLQYHGRWRSPQTLACYLQEAVAAAAWSTVPPAARVLIADCRRLFAATAAPPAMPAPRVTKPKRRQRKR